MYMLYDNVFGYVAFIMECYSVFGQVETTSETVVRDGFPLSVIRKKSRHPVRIKSMGTKVIIIIGTDTSQIRS